MNLWLGYVCCAKSEDKDVYVESVLKATSVSPKPDWRVTACEPIKAKVLSGGLQP